MNTYMYVKKGKRQSPLCYAKCKDQWSIVFKMIKLYCFMSWWPVDSNVINHFNHASNKKVKLHTKTIQDTCVNKWEIPFGSFFLKLWTISNIHREFTQIAVQQFQYWQIVVTYATSGSPAPAPALPFLYTINWTRSVEPGLDWSLNSCKTINCQRHLRDNTDAYFRWRSKRILETKQSQLK